jgi:spermidine synthase
MSGESPNLGKSSPPETVSSDAEGPAAAVSERSAEILAQGSGPDGETLTLRRAAGGFEIVTTQADGRSQVAISSAIRRSERELVNVGLVPLRDRHDITVLLGGLGMGHVLAALLESPRIIRVDVVEHSPLIVEWNRSHLSLLHRAPPLDDTRVHVHQQDFAKFLRDLRYGSVPDLKLEGGGFLAVLLDLDDGPSGLRRAQNANIYNEDGLEDIETALRPGGVIALWSGQKEVELLSRLHARFQNLAEVAFPVDVPDSGGLDWLYRARKRAAVVRPRAQA